MRVVPVSARGMAFAIALKTELQGLSQIQVSYSNGDKLKSLHLQLQGRFHKVLFSTLVKPLRSSDLFARLICV